MLSTIKRDLITTPVQRIVAYIDGFNLFYGLRDKGWKRYYWLDLGQLIGNLLRPGEQLVAIQYFTARVYPEPNDPIKRKRQEIYLDALATIPILTTHFGYFLPKQKSCFSCGAIIRTYEEKMTDVNIAVSLLVDAQAGLFDKAMVVSGDSDLSGPIDEVRQRFPSKQVVVAFPPHRVSKKLQSGGPSFVIGRKKLQNSQFPTQLTNAAGNVLVKPLSWV